METTARCNEIIFREREEQQCYDMMFPSSLGAIIRKTKNMCSKKANKQCGSNLVRSKTKIPPAKVCLSFWVNMAVNKNIMVKPAGSEGVAKDATPTMSSCFEQSSAGFRPTLAGEHFSASQEHVRAASKYNDFQQQSKARADELTSQGGSVVLPVLAGTMNKKNHSRSKSERDVKFKDGIDSILSATPSGKIICSLGQDKKRPSLTTTLSYPASLGHDTSSSMDIHEYQYKKPIYAAVDAGCRKLTDELDETPIILDHGADATRDATCALEAYVGTTTVIKNDRVDIVDEVQEQHHTFSRKCPELGITYENIEAGNSELSETSSLSHLDSGMKTVNQINEQHSRRKSKIKHYLTMILEDKEGTFTDFKTVAAMKELLLSVVADADQGKSKSSYCHLTGISILNQYLKKGRNPRILEVLVPVLSHLASSDKNQLQAILTSHSCVDHILSCMQRFEPTKYALVHEECIMALNVMTEFPGAAVQFTCSVSDVHLLLKTMMAIKTNLSVQRAGLGILLHTAKVNHDIIASKGELVMKVVVAMMVRHRSNAVLCRIGTLLLRQIACLADADTVSTMIQVGVVPCLIRAMKRQHNHFSILRHSLAILLILCRADNDCPAARALVANPKSLVQIIRIIKKHEHHAFIQREAYKLLRRLQDLPSSSFQYFPDSVWRDDACESILKKAGIHGKVHRGRQSSA
jgi:hypothetical protein